MISRSAPVKSKADRARSNVCSPFRQNPQRPSIAGTGSPHCGQNGGSSRSSRNQHSGHAAPHRRSRTGERQTTQVTGNRRLRIESIKARWGNAKGDASIKHQDTKAQRHKARPHKQILNAALLCVFVPLCLGVLFRIRQVSDDRKCPVELLQNKHPSQFLCEREPR